MPKLLLQLNLCPTEGPDAVLATSWVCFLLYRHKEAGFVKAGMRGSAGPKALSESILGLHVG